VAEKSPGIVDADLVGWARPEARLKDAFAQGAFSLYCQPILALAADPSGAPHYPMGELLVRMREEEQAMMPPGEFLPVLEHYGLMPLLDRWVVSRLARHLAKGSRLACFTMNVSSQTLSDEEFPSYVAAELKAARLPVDSVVFEIEESDVLAQEARVARFVAAMKGVGAGVLIDGFGRKSVSFTPLKTVGARFVKVDGSIIRKILKSEAMDNKLKAVVRVAEAIGVGVIAECVEEQDILVRIKALGVGYAQGFGVYRPHPIDSVAT